jgi:DNA-damage-inducible protein D
MIKNENIEPDNRLVVFQGKEVRRAWKDNEWYYSLVDVVGVLTDSVNSTDYLKKIRKRDAELGFYIGTNCPHVEMETYTGKKRKTLAGNTKDVFRLIQVYRKSHFLGCNIKRILKISL